MIDWKTEAEDARRCADVWKAEGKIGEAACMYHVACVMEEASLQPARGEGAVAVPKVQATAPKRIYLVVSDMQHDADEVFPDSNRAEICWCEDAPMVVCVPYVRADLSPTPGGEPVGDGESLVREVIDLARSLGPWDGKTFNEDLHKKLRQLVAATDPQA